MPVPSTPARRTVPSVRPRRAGDCSRPPLPETDLSDLIVRTRALHPREAARSLVAAAVDVHHGHLQDDATVMCLDRYGVGHSRRDADTGADLADASAPSQTGRTAPGS
ncbi:hypothetical protein SGLAM104S_08542 [Streptomyces glaucescens]